MDAKAKQHIQVARQTQRHFYTAHEPWSITHHNVKLTSNLDSTLYDIVHTPLARKYWQTKQDLPDAIFEDIHWSALHEARKSSPLQMRTFITKHSVGMCGVGKFLTKWRQRETAMCPRCGLYEDATHVLKCHGENADCVWETSLSSLQDWLESKGTDPDVSLLLIQLLQAWRDDTAPPEPPYGLSHLVERQMGIGCEYLLYGWFSWEWEAMQQAYYTFSNSRRTGKRWLIQLIKKLWNVSWDLWNHRNGILHKQSNLVSEDVEHRNDLRISSLYGQLQLSAADRDLYLLRRSLPNLLSTDITFKLAWVRQATVAINSIRSLERERRLAQQHQLQRMQQTLRLWLTSAR